MYTYFVTLRSAAGRERVLVVDAKTDQGASNAALKKGTPDEMVSRVSRRCSA